MESEKSQKADFKCSKNTKIQHNLQELEKVTKQYCQPNPAWRQAEEEEFLHNLMMNLPKKKREKYQMWQFSQLDGAWDPLVYSSFHSGKPTLYLA